MEGRALVYPDGTPFVWRGATGFLVTEQVVRGREADARAFLAWAKRTGFNTVRVLAMLPGGWEDGFAFTPEEGLAALPRVFALARDADLYVHLTVLNNTRRLREADLGGLVERAGASCAADPVCAVLEVANEPYHRVQRDVVGQAASLRAWARRVPAIVPVALGAAGGDDSLEMAGGSIVIAHLDRGGEPWAMVARMRMLAAMAETAGKPVLNSEPDGFAEVACVPRRIGCYPRQTDPALAFGFGAMSRVLGVGTTFHFEDGLRARVPGPVQQRAAAAFIEGTRVVPDDERPVSFAPGTPGSPVASVRTVGPIPRPNAAVAAIAGTAGNRGILVLLGVCGDPGVVLADGWQTGPTLADRPGVRVIAIERR